MNILLLMMGGSGTRFGSALPKQFTLVNDIPVFAYILKGYASHEDIDKIIIVTHKDWTSFVQEWANKLGNGKVAKITNGGSSRSESVLNGLSAALADGAESRDVVLIHDATHPYVDNSGISLVIQAVKEYGGATLGACQYDTCYRMNQDNMIQEVIPRQELISGASPEAFRFGDIYSIYADSTKDELEQMTSAGAIALAHGIPMKVIPANVLNLKITYPDDMLLFRHLAHPYFFNDWDRKEDI